MIYGVYWGGALGMAFVSKFELRTLERFGEVIDVEWGVDVRP